MNYKQFVNRHFIIAAFCFVFSALVFFICIPGANELAAQGVRDDRVMWWWIGLLVASTGVFLFVQGLKAEDRGAQ